MAKKSRKGGCVNAKARVRVGRKHGRCHLGKNGRIYCCTSTKPSRHKAKTSPYSIIRRARAGASAAAAMSRPPSVFVPKRNVRGGSGRAYMLPRAFNPRAKFRSKR